MKTNKNLKGAGRRKNNYESKSIQFLVPEPLVDSLKLKIRLLIAEEKSKMGYK